MSPQRRAILEQLAIPFEVVPPDYVEDDPPDSDPDLLGVYEGYALTSRGWDYAGVLPDRIIIFRNPILDLCTSEDEVVEEVAVTVVHEIAHHFGIDDARLDELGWG